MDSTKDITVRRERLRLKAVKKNGKASRLLKKIEKEMRKRQPDMTKVLSLQRKSNKLVKQGLRHLNERDALVRSKSIPEPVAETEQTVTFNVQKISERFVKKFGATSCVYRATMEQPKEGESFKVKDILTELSSLFTDTIDKVMYKHIGIWFYCNRVICYLLVLCGSVSLKC